MKRLAIALLFVCVTPAVVAAPFNRVKGAVKNRYIVVLQKDTPAHTHANELARGANARAVHIYGAVLNGFSIVGPEQAAEAIAKMRGVESVWEVPTVSVTDVQYAPPQGLDRIDQRDRPLDGSYTYALDTDPPTTVYITDTGVDPRNDFGGRLVMNINFTTAPDGARDPNDYTDYGLPLNDVWHGTTSAVLAAGTNYGVAKFAYIANVRILRYDSGTYDDVVAGIDWVSQQARARPAERHVANASWGSATPYPPAETALRNSVAVGVAWVFGAGNNGVDACTHSPARLGSELSGAITVGAMAPATDRVTDYSNQGPCVEIFAPSEVAWGTEAETNGTVASGTSAAAPHVAGVYAIRLAGAAGTIAEVEGLIKGLATADRLTNVWPTSPNLLLFALNPKRRSVGS